MVLGSVSWGDSAVCLPAGVRGGAARGGFGVPFEDPVAVAVGTDAGCVEGGAGLAVFAPEAVGCLGVDEAWVKERLLSLIGFESDVRGLRTIRIVEGDQVKVVVV